MGATVIRVPTMMGRKRSVAFLSAIALVEPRSLLRCARREARRTVRITKDHFYHGDCLPSVRSPSLYPCSRLSITMDSYFSCGNHGACSGRGNGRQVPVLWRFTSNFTAIHAPVLGGGQALM